MPEQITLWIPKGINPDSKTMEIASTMMNDFGVSQINNDTYNNNYGEYYNKHIRHGETRYETFCLKNGVGINVNYLIENANKPTYVTLLSLDVNPDDPSDFNVLATIVFKWSPTANSAKIQAFCSNQKLPSKGAGTKLLNLLKKVLTRMGLNNIYLNPVPEAISYYSKQQFVEARNPKKKVYDTSSPKSKTKSKSTSPGSNSNSKSKSKSKSKTYKNPPTMTINLRASSNWKKAKTKMSSYSALTRKTHGKSHVPTSTKVLMKKVDEIVNGLGDLRDFAEYRDIILLLNKQGIDLNDEEEDMVRRYLMDQYDMY